MKHVHFGVITGPSTNLSNCLLIIDLPLFSSPRAWLLEHSTTGLSRELTPTDKLRVAGQLYQYMKPLPYI